MRKAVCYAFADYLCRLAGDFVDITDNPYYKVFSSKSAVLAPGITQQINYATTVDDKQLAYYVATVDVTREDVSIMANYASRYPTEWAMARVIDQANTVQAQYGSEDSEHYIPNFNAIVATNAGGYDMSDGDPGGLLVMHGETYKPVNSNGFFAILKNGRAVIGTQGEWNAYADQVEEAIGGFGTILVKDGKVAISASSNYYTSRAPRTAVGITKTGKVVMMVLDGRQEPFSAGGSMEEIAQIMFEAGCVHAINLDGGGSSTFVARQPGDDFLSTMNRPSDGAARSISTSLLAYSLAPSSTKFDHALLETDVDYLTVGTTIQVTATGLSATGNQVDLPEGATWAVSDEAWASITEDGVLMAKKLGAVDVYLMDGEVIIGNKTLNIVNPDQIYFTKEKIDAVYGMSVALPLKALYDGKEVAITSNDINFTLGSEAAGRVEGFTFIVADSGLKAVKVNAALAADPSVTASLNVALYQQGENSFDFNQSTGGDRLLAWDRHVSNSTTEDNSTYLVKNPDEDMVTTYVIAMDMTEIPVPERLEELTYMLPGADMEGASAWTFLMQLAERVSVLTEVTAEITFDKNFDVDISNIKLINDYFTIGYKYLDTETNTMTVRMNWIDQTAALDPEAANPLCIVNGIKLTPKADADWGEKNTLNVANVGKISYDIYLRASGLYSFSVKPENQEVFGLYPFINPNDSSEKGGHFKDVYKNFEDTYTLINALKNGWYIEDGGYAYYIDSEKLTGIHEVEGYYYDFGENGINIGQTKLTALFYDETVGVYRYAKEGLLQTGWQSIEGEWYYFENYKAVSGEKKVGAPTYTFEENGRMAHGVWLETSGGWRYYNGPSYYEKKWQEIDGEWYYFLKGYRVTGYKKVGAVDNAANKLWFDFGEDGISKGVLPKDLYEIEGKLYYIIDGEQQVGLHKVNGDYYFFLSNGDVARSMKYYAWETHCDLPCANYYFDADGKVVDTGLVWLSDGLYYVENRKLVTNDAGLRKIGDDYYFVASNGRCATGEYNCWATKCDLPTGTYEFDAECKMIAGPIK